MKLTDSVMIKSLQKHKSKKNVRKGESQQTNNSGHPIKMTWQT